MDVWSGKGGSKEQDKQVLDCLDKVRNNFHTLIEAVAPENKKESHEKIVNNAIDTLKKEYNIIVTPATGPPADSAQGSNTPVNNLSAAGSPTGAQRSNTQGSNAKGSNTLARLPKGAEEEKSES